MQPFVTKTVFNYDNFQPRQHSFATILDGEYSRKRLLLITINYDRTKTNSEWKHEWKPTKIRATFDCDYLELQTIGDCNYEY